MQKIRNCSVQLLLKIISFPLKWGLFSTFYNPRRAFNFTGKGYFLKSLLVESLWGFCKDGRLLSVGLTEVIPLWICGQFCGDS